MKKAMFILVALVLISTVAMAQTIGTTGYNKGQGIINMDKLGAHQNGGRGCVGCHAPHSGARGNGGTLTWKSALDGNNKWTNQTAITGNSGEDALWGQDLGPVLRLGTITSAGKYAVDLSKAETTQP